MKKWINLREFYTPIVLESTFQAMKKQEIILSLFLCAIAQGTWAWSGEGTAESPYLIKTTDDLNELAQRVNTPQGESLNGYEGICFQL